MKNRNAPNSDATNQPEGGANRRRADNSVDERSRFRDAPSLRISPIQTSKASLNLCKSDLPKPVLEPRPEPPAHRQRFRQAAQVNTLAGLHPLDILEIYDRRPVYAHELPVGEALLPFPERFRRRLSR